MMTQKTVLIVEDEPRFRASIRAYLEDSGYRILEAADGFEGIRLFKSESPNLVLTDLRMPVMDGFELIARLKTASPKTPVIVLTGTGDNTVVAKAREQGVSDCLIKPIDDMKMLEAAIEYALE
jgi:CheY-like chemotaxis protein